MCNATPARCRWGCGNQCAHPVANQALAETFAEVSARRFSRRHLLGGAAAAGALLVIQASPLGGAVARAQAPDASGLTFTPIGLTTGDTLTVPRGYTARVLIRWGDSIQFAETAPAAGTITPERQRRSFGYNCDYVGYLPLGAVNSLLVVNHEYTNPELMFAGYDANAPTKNQVDVELAAHGMSVVELLLRGRSNWSYKSNGQLNRRIHGLTPIGFTGPAAGHALMQTTDDPAGETVLGMLNNCGGGITPWGTVLTCEENFNQYFANRSQVTDPAKLAAHQRYGLTTGASERKWERFYPRFDMAQEPNEPFRFGWVVEVDPYNRQSTPRKHTALGRFKHEGTSTVIASGGQAVVYMGDDERFDYMYKFVSAGIFDPSDRAANMELMADGTLYVARFNDDGTGTWLPLTHGSGPLTAENGFADQGEVMIKTRLAADLLLPTKMDRPEDIEVNPVNGKVYAVMTNNSSRTEPNGPNPRVNNRSGHIIEITPTGGDHAGLSFEWDIFMLCGDPTDASTYFAGFDKTQVSAIACPDNITFDKRGNLWIATDALPNVLAGNDGVFVVPVEGDERGHLRQFFSGVTACETASLVLDDANRALFVTIQHPGEGSTFASPTSNFPDGGNRPPKPSVVVVTRNSGDQTIGA
jgi:secreted PhoX family phosphatase